MTPLDAIRSARAAIDALEASLKASGVQPVRSADPQERPAGDSYDHEMEVIVRKWTIAVSKAGTSYARLETDGDNYLVFGEELVAAMDPLFPGDLVLIQVKCWTSKQGVPGKKIVGYTLVRRAAASPRDQRDERAAFDF
jgi:hypothetical protein